MGLYSAQGKPALRNLADDMNIKDVGNKGNLNLLSKNINIKHISKKCNSNLGIRDTVGNLGNNNLGSGNSGRQLVNGSARNHKNKNKKISVYYCNARSLRNKFRELIAEVVIKDYDVICVSESWVSEDYNKDLLSEYEISGFDMHIFQRIYKQGVGVILYAKSDLVVTEVNCTKQGMDVESVWVDIVAEKNVSVRVGLFYRPPDTSVGVNKIMIEEINRGITKFGNNKPVIILGDFNYPDIDWDLVAGNVDSSDFINCIQDNFLE